MFDKALGIGCSDWRYLAFQLTDALVQGDPSKTRGRFVDQTSESLVQFHINVQCLGLNGRVANVRAGWKIDSSMRISLVTAVVDDPKKGEPTVKPSASLVPAPAGPDQFARILRDASAYATAVADGFWTSQTARDGRELVSERDRQHVTIAVDVSPGSFGEWIDLSGEGELTSEGEIEIGVPALARQRALPWGEAFARVLALNGIHCEMHFWDFAPPE